MAKAIPIPQPTEKDWARFMSRVRILPNGCWEWTGGKFAQGYGSFRLGGKNRRAHRVLYVWLKGEIPDDHKLDHKCRYRPCVNPDHVEPATDRANILSGVGPTAKNAQKTHCVHGHALEGDNLYIAPKNGWRSCKTCRETNQKKRHPLPHNGVKTHCKHGHPLSGDNLIVTAKQRSCRMCARARNVAYEKRKRAQLTE